MARRSPVRLLAPLALVGFVLALLLVLNGSNDSGTRPASQGGAAPKASPKPTRTPRARSRQSRTYTVKPGDTPSSISVKTHVSLAEIQRLNPSLDPQLLAPGDRIKLRP